MMDKQRISKKYYRFYNSIRFKYLLYLLVSAGLIFGGLLLYNYILFQFVVRSDANAKSKDTSLNIAFDTNAFFSHITQTTESFEAYIRNNEIEEKELQDMLCNFLLFNPEIFACRAIFDSENHVKEKHINMMAYREYINDSSKIRLNMSPEKDYINKSNLPAFEENSYFSMPYNDEFLDGASVFFYVSPVSYIDKEKKCLMKGAIYVYLSVDRFSQWLESRLIFPEGFAAILGPEMELMAYSPDYEINPSLLSIAKKNGYRDVEAFMQHVITEKSGRLYLVPDSSIDYGYVTYEQLKLDGWNVAVILSDESFLKNSKFVYTNLIRIGILGLVLLFFVFFCVITRITRPLSELADSTNKIAEGDFDVQLPLNESKDEVGRLTHSMQSMINELKIYFEKVIEKERLEGELRVAKDIQKSIVPANYPAFQQLGSVDIYGRIQPANEVGGDFFDYFLYKERYLIFAIGDVSGQGIPAALLMAVARTLFRANVSNANPGEMITAINKELCLGNESNMFVTLFIGVLDSQTGILNYSNAGHNYPMLKKEDNSICELKQTHGIPLGMLDTLTYHSDKIQMNPGDTLVAYTDGVSESRKSESQFLGIEGIKEFMKNLFFECNSFDIVNRLIEKAEQYSSDYKKYVDDITVLSVRYLGENMLTMEIKSNIEEIRKVQKKLFEFCSKQKIEKDIILKVNLAVEELLMNIITYAYNGDETQSIFIQLISDEKELKVSIKDTGPPFEITKHIKTNAMVTPGDIQIGGWGIFLVNEIMDKIEYTEDIGNCNIITLFKKIEKL